MQLAYENKMTIYDNLRYCIAQILAPLFTNPMINIYFLPKVNIFYPVLVLI